MQVPLALRDQKAEKDKENKQQRDADQAAKMYNAFLKTACEKGCELPARCRPRTLHVHRMATDPVQVDST